MIPARAAASSSEPTTFEDDETASSQRSEGSWDRQPILPATANHRCGGRPHWRSKEAASSPFEGKLLRPHLYANDVSSKTGTTPTLREGNRVESQESRTIPCPVAGSLVPRSPRVTATASRTSSCCTPGPASGCALPKAAQLLLELFTDQRRLVHVLDLVPHRLRPVQVAALVRVVTRRPA